MCDLSHRQAPDGRRGQERVCAAAGQGKRPVTDGPPSQHQDIVEQEQAHVTELLVGPDGFRFCWVTAGSSPLRPQAGVCTLPERVWKLLATTSEQNSLLGQDQLPASFPQALHTHEWTLTCARIRAHVSNHMFRCKKWELCFYRTALDHLLRLLQQGVSL